MKVYLTTGYENPKKSSESLDNIIAAVKGEGHTIIKRPLKAHHGDETYRVNEKQYQDIFDFINVPIETIYSESTKRIKNSDVVIAEASYFVSPGVGFELAFALHEKKPVLVLINKNSDIVLSEVIEGNPSKLLTTVRFENQADLTKDIKQFLLKSKKKLDTKFILIISPEIDRYLQWAGNERRMHKAQLVRQAIEEMIERDKEYRVFQNQSR